MPAATTSGKATTMSARPSKTRIISVAGTCTPETSSNSVQIGHDTPTQRADSRGCADDGDRLGLEQIFQDTHERSWVDIRSRAKPAERATRRLAGEPA